MGKRELGQPVGKMTVGEFKVDTAVNIIMKNIGERSHKNGH
jgi:hypothetical protein